MPCHRVGVGASKHLLKIRPDQPLEYHLVFVLCCLESEVALLFQFEELLSVTTRKIIPLADSRAETVFSGIGQHVHKGLDSVALNRAEIDGGAASASSGHRKPCFAPPSVAN